jgi:site-specific recombinase XerD
VAQQLDLPGISDAFLGHLLEESVRLVSSTQSPQTRACYGRDQKAFQVWCRKMQRSPLPASAETVVLYLTDCLERGKRITTVRRYLSALNDAHRSAKFPKPAEQQAGQLLDGAQRLRLENARQKTPVTVEQLRLVCTTIWTGSSAAELRNKAILVFGFASALRQSSITALDLADVHFVEQGVVVSIHREKQDQVGEGREIAIAYGSHVETCPVRHLAAWLKVRGTAPGPLFTAIADGKPVIERLYSRYVSKVVKLAMRSLSLDPKSFGGHSLRSGLISEALLQGIDSIVLATYTGHRSLNSLRRYFRRTSLWRRNPSAMIGL